MTAALSFPTCLVLAGVISFMMEDTSGFLISEVVFGMCVFVAYFWLVESKKGEFASGTTNFGLVDPVETTNKQPKNKSFEGLALKQAELQAQEEEFNRKALEAAEKANAEQEAKEAQRLKQIEVARLQAEAEQAARLKEEAAAKERALEAQRVQKELEVAARLQAEAEEATRLQAELEEEARKQAEAEAKRKVEEEAARLKAIEDEERKLQQIEETRALAEAEQAARLQAEAEAKAKAKAEEAARHEAEEKERAVAQQKLKDEGDEAEDESEEFSLAALTKSPPPSNRKSLLESAFQGSMGYLANTDAAVHSTLSMRVRILNETTGRSKDVIVPVTPHLTIEEGIYSNLKVRESGVRKWPKELAREVKEKTAEVVCLLLNPNTTNVMHTYSIEDMKQTSTEDMHTLAAPEWDQTVRMLLKCQRIPGALTDSGADELPNDLDQSALFSIADVSLPPNNDIESKDTPTTVDVTISEDSENDITEEGAAKEQRDDGRSSPKGNDSVDGDGAQSVSDGSTYSSRSIEEKRRRKRELEAKRLSISSPTSETKPPAQNGGFSLSRFFSRQEQA